MPRKKILVLDDSATTRLSLAKILSEAGCESLGAEDGEQALTLVENGTFDLLMPDLNMPKMDVSSSSARFVKSPARGFRRS